MLLHTSGPHYCFWALLSVLRLWLNLPEAFHLITYGSKPTWQYVGSFQSGLALFTHYLTLMALSVVIAFQLWCTAERYRRWWGASFTGQPLWWSKLNMNECLTVKPLKWSSVIDSVMFSWSERQSCASVNAKGYQKKQATSCTPLAKHATLASWRERRCCSYQL